MRFPLCSVKTQVEGCTWEKTGTDCVDEVSLFCVYSIKCTAERDFGTTKGKLDKVKVGKYLL